MGAEKGQDFASGIESSFFPSEVQDPFRKVFRRRGGSWTSHRDLYEPVVSFW